jgi:hypothetical protein
VRASNAAPVPPLRQAYVRVLTNPRGDRGPVVRRWQRPRRSSRPCRAGLGNRPMPLNGDEDSRLPRELDLPLMDIMYWPGLHSGTSEAWQQAHTAWRHCQRAHPQPSQSSGQRGRGRECPADSPNQAKPAAIPVPLGQHPAASTRTWTSLLADRARRSRRGGHEGALAAGFTLRDGVGIGTPGAVPVPAAKVKTIGLVSLARCRPGVAARLRRACPYPGAGRPDLTRPGLLGPCARANMEQT